MWRRNKHQFRLELARFISILSVALAPRANANDLSTHVYTYLLQYHTTIHIISSINYFLFCTSAFLFNSSLCSLAGHLAIPSPASWAGVLAPRVCTSTCTRNFLTFINTTAIAYGQIIARSLKILVLCNSGRVYKHQKITSTAVGVEAWLGMAPVSYNTA